MGPPWLHSLRQAYTWTLRLDALESLKTRVRTLDEALGHARREALLARKASSDAQMEIRECASEVNGLLHRKSAWTSSDAQKFSELCQKEIILVRREEALSKALVDAEEAAEGTLQKFLSVLRERYQEEMALSEASRRVGYILMGFNTILFGLGLYDRQMQRSQSEKLELLIQDVQHMVSAERSEVCDEHTANMEANKDCADSLNRDLDGEFHKDINGILDADINEQRSAALHRKVGMQNGKQQESDANIPDEYEQSVEMPRKYGWVVYGGWAAAVITTTLAILIRQQ